MLGKRIINTGGVSCTTDTTQILNAGTTQSLALYRFEDNANDTASSTGKFNKGGVFNGSSSKIDLPDNILPDNSTGSSSASVWFKSSSGNTAGDSETILDAYAYDTNKPGWGLFMEPASGGNPDGHLYLANYSLGGTSGGTSTGYRDGEWHHAVVVLDNPNNTIKLYIDGNSTPVLSQTASAANVWPFTEKAAIGYQNANASYPRYFNGHIDQVRIFNKALSTSEITTLYNETTTTANTLQVLSDTSCVAAYTFEGNANDLSTNYNGTASNVVYDYSGTASSSLTYVTGKFGKAASFNGSSGRVVLPSGEPFGDSDTIKCISAWIKPSSTSARMHVFSTSGNDAYDYFRAVYDGNNSVISTYSRRDNTSNYSYQYASITPDTNWHHVVFQLGSSGVEIYLDNTKLTLTSTTVGSATNSSWIAYPNYAGTIVTQIGKSRQVTPQWSDGLQDQTRLFNKALSPGEINSLYNETATSAASATIDSPSTVAYYKMADGTDETGNYDATTVSNVDFNVQGKYGFAGKFNGSSSQIITGLTPQAGTTAATISLWINFNSYANSYAVIAGDNNSGTTANGFLILATGAPSSYGSNGHLWVSLGDQSGGYNINTSVSFDSYGGIGSWIHVAVTVSGTSVSIYMNGTLATSYTSTVSYAPTASAHNYRFGYISGWGYLDAKLDQIRFFNRAISSSEVTKLYNEVQCANTITAPENYFNTKLFTPTTSTSALPVTGVGFSPGLAWAKYRGTGSGASTQSHYWVDSVRGINSRLFSNSTSAESTTNYVQSFDSDGITYVNNLFNRTGADSVVGWFWKAASSDTTNNDGTISSTVRASQESGFSIAKYVGNGSAGATVGHGLSKIPSMIITKGISGSAGATNWNVYTSITGATKKLVLNSTAGENTNTTWWNDTAPTASVFSLGTTGDSNYNGSNFIAYCFANIDGYQRIGSYAGNGSANGPFVYTGFEPAWLLIKQTSSSGNDWVIYDNKRNTTNPRFKFLVANDSDAETGTNASNWPILDFLSNGFIIKGTDGRVNTSGSTYLFWAIAANPDTSAPTKANSFKTVLYTGNGGTQSITGAGFKPDLAWVKRRSNSEDHVWFDTVRGVQEQIRSNSSGAQSTKTNALSSFNSDGFTTGANNALNTNNETYVAWLWKALDHDRNLASINNDGENNTIVSVNEEAGFGIVKGSVAANGYTASLGHGFEVKPEFIIYKPLNMTSHWFSFTEYGGSLLGTNNVIKFSGNDASQSDSLFRISDKTFKTGTTSSAHNFIAYCFRSVTGYSKVGTYTGQTAGVTITTGFQPSFIMIKSSSNVENWAILDTERGTGKCLNPNLSNAESDSTLNTFTVSSTGFSFPHQNTADAMLNENGYQYIYLAIK